MAGRTFKMRTGEKIVADRSQAPLEISVPARINFVSYRDSGPSYMKAFPHGYLSDADRERLARQEELEKALNLPEDDEERKVGTEDVVL